MEPQDFKSTDELWFLNDNRHLVTASPDGNEPGFVGFIALEEATIFLADSNWDKNLMAAKLTLEQLWTTETLPVYVFTPTGGGSVAVQTLKKEDICG